MVIFSIFWFPYRSFFKHRSRFSHGLIFGALIRVIYFLGVVTLAAYLLAFVWTRHMSGGSCSGFGDFADVMATDRGIIVRSTLARIFLLLVFVGLWLGAASHTFTDMAGIVHKNGTGREISLARDYRRCRASSAAADAWRRTASETLRFFDSAIRSRSCKRAS